MNAHAAEQLYTITELAHLLRLQPRRVTIMARTGEMLGPDVLIPGGGKKAARWSASRVEAIRAAWAHPCAS